jgi:hypothetical protein
VSASPKIGYFTISPSISYNEKWYNKWTKIENVVKESVDSSGNVKKTNEEVHTVMKELHSVRTYSMSVSASTKIYGMMQPNILGIEAFRHSITPSVSYNFTPNFSDDKWGYYDTYVDSTGKKEIQ